ncbi:LysR family transcriptional regulator [Pedobacter nutrimenti]|uniref:DNA-binding transcriptional LysR family regulator n=1 Tax=Pedobacter nutrimenti TaxID=1241337 RepID=A0A318UN91_9SPHI|nr:LysR family transcriptional regulator [Pedobacter nutrimenti]PYF77000.1 DNA-binding transcriptional LysR family regulator [Pedobacter nutrimenti]
MVNLEWYRTFKAIYETGTLTGAAEALYISQPGVSLHLSSLESYVGYKLFDRTSRKMVSTEKGKILYNFIQEALCKLESAEQHFHKSTEKDTPTISIGMCFETFQITLEPYLPELPFNVIIKFGEYPQMISDLDSGILDLIITPQKDNNKNIEYTPFSKELIVLVAGKTTDTRGFEMCMNNSIELEKWLKQQKWYGTTGDMEHLIRFWHANFSRRPDFKPNYIVPNLNSIVRCLTAGGGFAVIPDFLCKREIDNGDVKLVWEGDKKIENTLYFGNRKKTIYEKEIKLIQQVFEKEMT